MDKGKEWTKGRSGQRKGMDRGTMEIGKAWKERGEMN